MPEPKGWYSRGYLPHIDAGSVPQFITWRLKDSIPAVLYEQWKEELEVASEPARKRELYSRAEKYMDQGHGSCVLKNPVAASITQGALTFYHGTLYQLHGWCVMPNHVHCLLTPSESTPLMEILKRVKGYSSTEIHKALGGRGHLWQEDYFDRMMRDEGHFLRVLKYIEWNPVKAKLCTDPARWAHSSANPQAASKIC